jgi:hypothetical protein
LRAFLDDKLAAFNTPRKIIFLGAITQRRNRHVATDRFRINVGVGAS